MLKQKLKNPLALTLALTLALGTAGVSLIGCSGALTSSDNLRETARIAMNKGDYKASEEALKSAISKDETAGEESTGDLAEDLRLLGMLNRKQGKLDDAEKKSRALH